MHRIAEIFEYALQYFLEEYYEEYEVNSNYYSISDTISFAEFFYFGDYFNADSRRKKFKQSIYYSTNKFLGVQMMIN